MANEALKALHDGLLASPNAGDHEAATCPICLATTTTPSGGTPVSVKTYNEDEVRAQVAAAVDQAVGDMRTQLDALRQSQEQAAIDERIQTAVAEATGPLETRIGELQAALDTATTDLASEKATREALETEKAEAARKAEQDALLGERVAAVKDVIDLGEDNFKLLGPRWAAMAAEDFEARLEEYRVVAGKTGGGTQGGGGLPATTPLKAAVEDTGAPNGGRSNGSAVKAFSAAQRSGFDPRRI